MSESETAAGSSDLTVGRSRLGLFLTLVIALGLLAVAGWFATHPEPLPTSGRAIAARTPVGVPVYVGVYAGTSTDRTLDLTSVHVNAPEDSSAVVTAEVCVDGSLSVTADPRDFCARIVPASKVSVGPGDVLMLRIQSQTAGTLTLDDLQVSYREGLQWGTQPVGPPVTVTFLGR